MPSKTSGDEGSSPLLDFFPLGGLSGFPAPESTGILDSFPGVQGGGGARVFFVEARWVGLVDVLDFGRVLDFGDAVSGLFFLIGEDRGTSGALAFSVLLSRLRDLRFKRFSLAASISSVFLVSNA